MNTRQHEKPNTGRISEGEPAPVRLRRLSALAPQPPRGKAQVPHIDRLAAVLARCAS